MSLREGGGGGLTSSPFGGAVACSRLSDSSDDAKMKRTRKYEGVIWEKRGGGSAVSSRFIFVIALSRFRGPGYLGAWNRSGDLRVVKLSDSRTRKETPLL